ncbi:MAG: cytochrome monooxygenase [Actinoplanes sp.]|jgi:cytochrome P450 monooxygenase|nr:cytochrome monooxygenase [Actinoplanes sp.]
MTTTTDPSTVEFPVRVPGRPFPPPEYDDLRTAGPVRSRLPDGRPVWLVLRHSDVRTVLTSRSISSNPSHPGFPQVGKGMGVPKQEDIPGWFVGLDPPDHDRFRRALIPEFTVRRIRDMRPAIQRTVDDRIDAMLAAGDSTDLIAEYALPIPSLVISTLLGVPPVDRDFFEGRTRTLISITSTTEQQRTTAATELLRYINRLIGIKQRWPGDDMTTRLLANGVLSPQEMSGVLMLLLIAGHETTANNLGLGVTTLLANPQWKGDDRAVEEVLRYHSVADLVCLRVAVEDVEIGGQLIKAGEGLMPLVAAANYDESVFECPHAFNPGRTVRQHVAFGYGVHQCLGQNLVRMELEIAFRTLFERIPSIELATPLSELPFKYDGVLFGLHELPVRWTAARSAP